MFMGDNCIIVLVIVKEVGVDDFIVEVILEDKIQVI